MSDNPNAETVTIEVDAERLTRKEWEEELRGSIVEAAGVAHTLDALCVLLSDVDRITVYWEGSDDGYEVDDLFAALEALAEDAD